MIDYRNKAQAKKKSQPVKKITKVADKRKTLHAIYSIVRPIFLREHKTCEANLPGCTKRANQVHHKRGRRGILLVASNYFLASCDNCHKWITIHSKEAKEMDLSTSINTNLPIELTSFEQELINKHNNKAN